MASQSCYLLWRYVLLVSVVSIGHSALTAPSARAEYYPARPLYDYQKHQPHDDNCADPSNPAFDHGRCGPTDGPVFDSFINVPSWGDEPAFFDAVLSNHHAAGSHHDPLYYVTRGSREVVLRVFVDNDANEYFGYKTAAQGTRVQVTLPTRAASSLRARALISAPNATPPEVEDTVDLVDNRPFRVEYVPGSAMLYHDNRAQAVDDSIVAGGALITNKGIPGVFAAGFGRAAVVNVRVRIIPVSPPSHLGIWIVLVGAAGALLALVIVPLSRHRILRTANSGQSWIRQEGVRTQLAVGSIVALLVAGLTWLIKLAFA
jgi:hypothetical protein